MAKERLSQLQKWILTKCYKQGKDHYATPDYWCSRHYLVYNRIKEHLKTDEVKKYIEELQKGFGHYYDEKQQYKLYKDWFEISFTGSLKNLAYKGCIELLDKDRWRIRLDSKYRQATVFVQLKDKGVEIVENLILNYWIIKDKRKEGKDEVIDQRN